MLVEGGDLEKLNRPFAAARQTGRAVSKWSSVAKQMGIKDAEIDRMASAFEHADLEKAAKVS